MSRDDGFAVADIDSAYLEDAKMRALWQRLRDPDLMARAVLLHESALLSSWRHGQRVTVAESAPTWLPIDAALVAHLVAVKLLGKDGKVSPSSWKHWFGAAVARREVSRAKGRLGGLAKAERARRNSSPAVAQLEPGSSPALPVRPSVPTDPSTPQKETPQPPSRGGRRANGTNDRAIAAEMTRRAEQAERDRKARRQARYLAYSRGLITESQRIDMDDRDADLDEIPMAVHA